ncbi:MAG: hypothetical protein ABL949_09290 [Fimbriimonadaceae bacterium]
MKATIISSNKRAGQALPIAVIILAIVLVLGFVFAAILNRNLDQGAFGQRRSAAQNLAQAGIEFAHKQLQYSEKRADYRPPTIALSTAGDITKDPDAFYLRPGTGLGFRNAADLVKDLGGPDGLGAFSRYDYGAAGRALIRLRWAPSDPNLFDANPNGPLLSPGKARSYLILECVGRVGRIDPNDPTTQLSNGGVQYRNYAGWAAYRAAFEDMRARDNVFNTKSSRRLIALASIGIIEHALFVTNLDQVSKPMDLGYGADMGAKMDATTVTPVIEFGGPSDSNGGSTVTGGGSIWSNADLRFNGTVRTYLNQGFGDGIWAAGSVIGSDNAALLEMIRTKGDDTVVADNDLIQLTNATALFNGGPIPASLDSGSTVYSTIQGLLRDGIERTDPEGWTRNIGRKEAPDFVSPDPVTGVNTYFTVTRNSGPLNAVGNIGRFGHGRNVYVGNLSDRQIGLDESTRENAGSSQSMVYDWLNPNNGQANSGWQGPYYIPVGAYLRLMWDGFEITRDGRAPARERTWRRPDGSDSGLTTIRYRIGGDPDGPGPQPPYVINTLTNPADIDAAAPVWTNGFPFDGLLFFEGNVRVRGVIPTDVQLNVISMANIYIEGSITKGNVVDAAGTRLDRPSRSAMMLMAKDYVALNTPNFFGVSGGTSIEEVQETNDPQAGNAVRMRAVTGGISFLSELNWRTENFAGLPAVTPTNPQTWRPSALDYVDPASGLPIVTNLLFTHAKDNGAAPFAFFGADINFGAPASVYNFEMNAANSASPPYAAGTWQPVKGLGSQPWQSYPRMESIAYPLIRPTSVGFAGNTLTANEAAREGTYSMFVGHFSNNISLRSTNVGAGATNDTIIRRAAIVPHDIKVEAGIYAQEGSFFVIPGNWFNPNPNDSRAAWLGLGANNAARNAQRLSLYGSMPETPFYGEPLDVRVTILGSVSENMTQPASVQNEWGKKWSWIPREQGSSGVLIPSSHVPPGYNITGADTYVPNLRIIQDPAFATGRITGFVDAPDSYVRFTRVQPSAGVTIDYALPPMPRLPVSPTLAYYGEVNP